jgi:putative RNA 2'-phosphotransferase
MQKMNELSKLVSHALRHTPWLYELELDDDGWAPLDALIGALRSQRPEWANLSSADVEHMVNSSTKRRHEIVGQRIRALYGHSVPAKLRREAALPPTILFHGTSPEAANLIQADGLRPMLRQYVHLSVDIETAREVAQRKSSSPVLFEIDARAAHHRGVVFYAGNDKVWLADLIPVQFMRVVV